MSARNHMGLVVCIVFLLSAPLHVGSVGSLVTALALGKHSDELSVPEFGTSSSFHWKHSSSVLISLGYFK